MTILVLKRYFPHMYVAPSFPNVHYYYYTYMLCINIHICVCLCIAYMYNNVNKFIHKKLYVSTICISPLKPLLLIKANSKLFDTEILSPAFGHISSCGSLAPSVADPERVSHKCIHRLLARNPTPQDPWLSWS